MSKRTYRTIFGATQIVGMIVPSFGNAHENITPIAIGVALLFPGDSIGDRLHLASPLMLAVYVLVNAAVWYGVRKILLLDSP